MPGIGAAARPVAMAIGAGVVAGVIAHNRVADQAESGRRHVQEAEAEFRAWYRSLRDEFPDRAITTPAELERFERFLVENPAPEFVWARYGAGHILVDSKWRPIDGVDSAIRTQKSVILWGFMPTLVGMMLGIGGSGAVRSAALGAFGLGAGAIVGAVSAATHPPSSNQIHRMVGWNALEEVNSRHAKRS